MSPAVQVGTILLRESPRLGQLLLGFESKSYGGDWNLMEADNSTLDHKIQSEGWHFFFMAAELSAMFLGTVSANKVESTLRLLLRRTQHQHFNGLQVTGIVQKRFLSVPYVVVSAHARHIQPNCYLESAEERRVSQRENSPIESSPVRSMKQAYET